jgi:transcriptional regulator with XRE-family HTH domain
MSINELTVYDLWDGRDLMRPAIPPRSRLFHMDPIGIGTAGVESLTGYIARLAEAHGVEVNKLITWEILPRLGRANLLDPRCHGRTLFWQILTPGINGTQALAQGIVAVLETLTRRSNLRCLTMRTWAEVVPTVGLLHRTWAWCPACYEEWRQMGHVVYEPLLWAVEIVTVCPHHRRSLERVCPYPDCHRSRPVLGRRSRPGHCPWCGRWLGRSLEAGPVGAAVLTEDEWRWQSWVAEAVGELLAATSTLEVFPRRGRIVQGLRACVEQAAGGNLSALAEKLGLCRSRVALWKDGRHLPSLEMLVWVCNRLGTTPLRLLTDEAISVTAEVIGMPSSAASPKRQTTPPRRFDVDEARRALEAAVASAEEPPPSLTKVAQRLGCPPTSMQHHLPELCRLISARYFRYIQARSRHRRQQLCAEIRQATFQLHVAGLSPSVNRIASLISQPAFMIDPEARAARQEALLGLGLWV